jgi:hypothetical protein
MCQICRAQICLQASRWTVTTYDSPVDAWHAIKIWMAYFDEQFVGNWAIIASRLQRTVSCGHSAAVRQLSATYLSAPSILVGPSHLTDCTTCLSRQLAKSITWAPRHFPIPASCQREMLRLSPAGVQPHPPRTDCPSIETVWCCTQTWTIRHDDALGGRDLEWFAARYALGTSSNVHGGPSASMRYIFVRWEVNYLIVMRSLYSCMASMQNFYPKTTSALTIDSYTHAYCKLTKRYFVMPRVPSSKWRELRKSDIVVIMIMHIWICRSGSS